MRLTILFALLLGLASCSPGTPPVEESPGSIITGKPEQGISLTDITGNNNDGNVGMPVNALLWRASLDIIATIPLDDVDTFGGTIISEWYQLNADADERIKLAIFVLDRELRSDGVRVVVYVQKKSGDTWQDSGTDIDMGKKLEELILTRAREIRASSLIESDS